MADNQHCIAGFFENLTQAQATQAILHDAGLAMDRMRLFQPKTAVWPSKGDKLPQAGSDAARNDMLVDGAIGGAIGLGLGALTELAITAANVSLFVASPLLAPLVLLGWGATLGGTVGAMVGAEKQGAPLFELIRDAVSNGQVVLVVETRSEREASMTRSTMHKAVGDFRHLTVSDAQ